MYNSPALNQFVNCQLISKKQSAYCYCYCYTANLIYDYSFQSFKINITDFYKFK